MPEIVLSTLNAKYLHAAFGLRYLFANLGPLQSIAQILEFDINRKPIDIAECLLDANPKILGLGVYIWNTDQTLELVGLIKRIKPDVCVVIGGPEVSYDWKDQPLYHLSDYLITGEGDLAFANLCRDLLAGRRPPDKCIRPKMPDPSELNMPYDFYTDEDIRNRVVYVEASRGCPFTCEFCLSSLEIPVRAFDLDRFLQSMRRLLDRGLRRFKFVDRTFNLNLRVSRAILEFFLKNWVDGLFVHFEMVPDRLPEGLREVITQFPPGAMQFEIGIQTFNPEVAARISRRQDYARLSENFRFLRQQTGVHLHADLIVGLPGEDTSSFADGFDRLIALDPHEIQVGILKRLRGTPITRHDIEFKMVYSDTAPYEILQTGCIPFSEMQWMRRFARYWDIVGNSGNFIETTPLIWDHGSSPFWSFMDLTRWLYEQSGRTHGIALNKLVDFLFHYLTGQSRLDERRVAMALAEDYRRTGRTDLPAVLRPWISKDGPVLRGVYGGMALKRQSRRLVGRPDWIQ